MAKIRKENDKDVFYQLTFNCPACGHAHTVEVGAGPGPRWRWNGDYDAPTLTPSVNYKRIATHNVRPPHRCHFFVEDGRIRYLGDCTHDMANQTTDLPEID